MPEDAKEKQISLKDVIMLTTAPRDEGTKPVKTFPTPSQSSNFTNSITQTSVT